MRCVDVRTSVPPLCVLACAGVGVWPCAAGRKSTRTSRTWTTARPPSITSATVSIPLARLLARSDHNADEHSPGGWCCSSKRGRSWWGSRGRRVLETVLVGVWRRARQWRSVAPRMRRAGEPNGPVLLPRPAAQPALICGIRCVSLCSLTAGRETRRESRRGTRRGR